MLLQITYLEQILKEEPQRWKHGGDDHDTAAVLPHKVPDYNYYLLVI